MGIVDVAVMAAEHGRNALAEELYLYSGKDLTRPVTIYGTVNEVCNYQCGYCECWRMPNYKPEMSIEEWQKAILDLKDFLGSSTYNFPGGSLTLRKASWTWLSSVTIRM